MGTLDGKVAVITGGASGIGRATTERFVAEGAAVLIADIAADAGEEAAALLRAGGHRVAFHHYDAARFDDAEAVVRAAIEHFGGLDIGVACAGIVFQRSGEPPLPVTDHPDFLRFDPVDWQAMLAVNLTGAYVFLQACARALLDLQRPGSLVALTSVAAANPTLASNPAYAMSKAALTSIVRNLAPKLAPLGIRLNAVGPGITETAMSAGLLHDDERRRLALAPVPMGRMATPAEIANAVLFLVGDDSAFICGESLYVDGGFFTG